jgi:hypothetical protein
LQEKPEVNGEEKPPKKRKLKDSEKVVKKLKKEKPQEGKIRKKKVQ